jgi:alcohol dehydrogenase
MLGAAHACANPLTARYGITHGVALAILLPHVVRWNAAANRDLYGPLVAAAMNGSGGTSGNHLAERLVQIGRAGGFPHRLREAGVPEGELAALADQAGRQWTAAFNPVPFGHPDALEVYRCAY